MTNIVDSPLYMFICADFFMGNFKKNIWAFSSVELQKNTRF